MKDTLDAARSRQNGSAPPEASSNPVAGIDENAQLDKAAFDELLERIDRGLRALPATAQVPHDIRAVWCCMLCRTS